MSDMRHEPTLTLGNDVVSDVSGETVNNHASKDLPCYSNEMPLWLSQHYLTLCLYRCTIIASLYTSGTVSVFQMVMNSCVRCVVSMLWAHW